MDSISAEGRGPLRLVRHLFAPSASRQFPSDCLARIAAGIATSERVHDGEVCFAVEPGLGRRALLAGVTARDRAEQVFTSLRVWDTRANNGVLLYLLLADHRIEMVADRGFDGLVSAEQWRGVCLLMEERLRAGDDEAAVLAGVAAISALIAEHFPTPAVDDQRGVPDSPDNDNKVSDWPHLL